MKIQLGIGVIDFGELQLADWIRGGVAAFVSGGASAVVAGLAVAAKDPSDYGVGTSNFWGLVRIIFLTSGFLNFMAFIAKQPLPDVKKVEKTVTQTEIPGKPMQVVTAVRETTVEPVKKEDS